MSLRVTYFGLKSFFLARLPSEMNKKLHLKMDITTSLKSATLELEE